MKLNKMIKKLLAMNKLLLLMFIPLAACAAKSSAVASTEAPANEPVVERMVEQTVKEVALEELPLMQEEEKERPVECLHPFGKDPNDSLEMRRTFSLYQEEIENQNYVAAYPLWQKIMEKAPCARIGPYIDAETMFPQLFANPAFKDKQKVLLDSFLWSFPTRIHFHGDEGAVKGRWAYYLNYYKNVQYDEIILLSERAIELQQNKLEYIVPSSYMNAVFLGLKNKKLGKEKVFDAYERVSDIMEYNALNDPDFGQYWAQIQKDIEESIKTFLSCQDVDELFLPKHTENPTDVLIMEKLIKFYRASRCLDNPNYIAVLKNLFNVKPSSSSAEELAKFYDNTGDVKSANIYYEKAAEMTEDDKRKEFFFLKLASNNANSKNYNGAVTYANKVLSVNPNSGNAYVILAISRYQLAQANSSCDDFNKKAAAWVTIDLLQKAINVDPSVKDDAQKKINTYKNYAPDKNSGFFRSIFEGQAYTVDCIGVSTTARYFE